MSYRYHQISDKITSLIIIKIRIIKDNKIFYVSYRYQQILAKMTSLIINNNKNIKR